MTREQVLKRLAPDLAGLREQFGVKELYLFGSVARDEAGPESDLDFLVVFDGQTTFDRFMELKLHLEDVFGIRVDLLTPNALPGKMPPELEREVVRVA